MKNWLAKFKISAALDSETPSGSLGQAGGRSEDVMHFERSMRALDRRLKAARPAVEIPAGLHGSVMRSLRKTARSPEKWPWRLVLRWLTVPGLALLIAAAYWLSSTGSAPPSTALDGVVVTLDEGHELTQRAPGALLSPLSEEMDSLNRDLRSAVEHLVASVP